ncbi:tetratricopeptide repeat protein [Argonema antarcticum]|uniref:tetratricopeptide repeat protein n=1 Tax=Argonema antarcticum TaxID=2942763 RepID=UPI0020116451|nr:tetratricopeptide repeat protein [Argonema antarcticum]MCL1472063.1 tetratricopeptide repeat protein [Argonema antarcticum A004/B2]
MNEQRTQAYLNLIDQLLSCNEGDEPRILQENEELLDQGLIEVMIGVARQLERAGRENDAQWLMNIAQQLAQALGLLDNNPTESANTPQDYFNFLMEILQKVSENPDPQVIYPFWAQNLDKLNDNLIQILDSWAKNTLSSVAPKESEYIADVIFDFSSLIEQYSLGSIANNIELAIIGYQIALRILTFEKFRQDWAILQTNLAIAYSKRIRGDKADNLEQAIIYYQESLKVLTFELFPHDWAKIISNLANVYSNRIRGDKADNLEQAIIYNKKALNVLTFESFSQDWAGTKHNLAVAYSNRIRGNKADNLEQAIICFKEALKVRTFDSFPPDWASTQNNLGNAYSNRITGNKADNLERAIICYQEALKVRTLDAFPPDWATTKHNLAVAYSNRIRGIKLII